MPAATTSEAERDAVRAWVRLLGVQKQGLAAIRRDLEREMTLSRFDLLANLARKDEQTLASLSRSMLVTAGNLTGLVDRAARDGLLERRADPNDRRAWRVHITAKGLRELRSAERLHAARVRAVFGPLTHDELRALIALLDKLRAPMRAEAERPAQARARRTATTKATTRKRRTT